MAQDTKPEISAAEFFCHFFRGNPAAHYVRANGNYEAVDRAIEPADAERHLAGKEPSILSIPIVPSNNNCHFGAIDVDRHTDADAPMDHAALARRIAELNLPLVVCRSKNPKSAHLWLFLKEHDGFDAATTRRLLEHYREVLGLSGNYDIFPRQDTLKEGQRGNGINLPYFGGERIAFGRNGEELNLDGFLALASEKASFGRLLVDRDLRDATNSTTADAKDRPLPVRVIRELHVKNLQSLRAALPGGRNDLLNTVAFFAARAFAAKALDGTEADVKRAIFEAAKTCGLEEHEIRQTATSGWGSGITRPLAICDEVEIELDTISASSVRPEPIAWLWENKIPRHAITMFAGNPDVGKTTVALDIVARITRGRLMHGASNNWLTAGNVLILSAEDDPAVDLVPKLKAAGANLDFVHFAQMVTIRQGARQAERLFALDTDLKALADKLPRIGGIILIVIDPISAYFGRKKIVSTQEAREVLTPLAALCRDQSLSIIAIEHFTKRTDVGAIHKIGGAVAVTGGPRASFMFARDPDTPNQYLMHFIKGNRTKDDVKTGITYRFGEQMIAGLGPQPCIVWGQPIGGSADQVLSRADEKRKEGRADRAASWLSTYLADGREVNSVQLLEDAKKDGISRNACFEAKEDKIKVKVRKSGDQWFWSIANEPGPNASRSAPSDDQGTIPF